MRASDFRITLRRALRIPFPELAALPGGCCPLCGQQCDAHGDHADSCPQLAGLHDVAHNLVRDAVYVTAEEARLRPTLELKGLVPGTRQRPADVHLPAHVPHGLQPPVQQQPPPQPPPQQPAPQQPAAATEVGAARVGDAEAGARADSQAGTQAGAQGGASAPVSAPAAGAAGGACLDMVRVGTYAPSYVELGLQRALQEAHRRKALRPPPAGHFIVPIAFTTGGSFFEPTLRRAMSQWGALRLAEADAAGDDRELISAQRCVGLRWLPRLSAAAARGTAYLISRLLQAARGPDRLPLSDYVGTAADTRMRMTGAAAAGD